jgi:hypothetical protein
MFDSTISVEDCTCDDPTCLWCSIRDYAPIRLARPKPEPKPMGAGTRLAIRCALSFACGGGLAIIWLGSVLFVAGRI